jgi:hypothetical protein
MPVSSQIVSEVVAHIIHHVDAEDTLIQDPSQKDGVKDRADYVKESQKDGVKDRADYVKDAFQPYEDDLRDLPIYAFLQEVAANAPPKQLRPRFRRVISNIEAIEDPRPRLAIQHWVGTEEEERG